jgi:sarcosine oxidase
MIPNAPDQKTASAGPRCASRLDRRAFVKSLTAGAALAAGSMAARGAPQMATGNIYDAAVIGAGCFGAWIAHDLQESGLKVVLLDGYGPGNARSSSGGESRVIRMGYGADEIYARWAIRDLGLWRELSERVGQSLFRQTGVLWLAHESDEYENHCLASFQKLGVHYEKLARGELERRYPQIALGEVSWGLLEPGSGALLARRAVQAVVDEARRKGAEYRTAAVEPPRGTGKLTSVTTKAGDHIDAGVFVFACGPWLPKVFPELLGNRIFPTRQEVFFFGTPAGDSRFAPPAMPVWIVLKDEYYGLPDLESRGLKIAFDRHGPPFDPDSGARVVTAEGLQAAAGYLARRFPAMSGAPAVETRVCQYENTSNGDFLIDRHPDLSDVWLVGGGSGHGFKHGPSVGEYMAARITGAGKLEPRFTLATKKTVQRRAIF